VKYKYIAYHYVFPDYYYFLAFLVNISNINALTEIRRYLHLSKSIIINIDPQYYIYAVPNSNKL
jgi:hypothetical protein